MTGPEEELKAIIAREGPIPFSRFMERALYSPHGGYYAQGGAPGARGDYFTSPLAHPAFGALLAVQLWQCWELLERPARFWIAEVGAGTGHLARAILAFAPELSWDFAAALQYVAVDRALRCDGPAPADSGKVFCLRAGNLPLRGVTGCIIANELLDAFPVHRFKVSGGRLLEVYVTVRDGAFQEVLAGPSGPAIQERLELLQVPLAEGLEGEVCLELEGWAGDCAHALRRGFVLTFDYGGLASELYAAGRRGGTVRCYYRHTLSGDPYRRAGQQDITAHVDFSSLVLLGRQHGLEPLGYAAQRRFLLNLGWEAMLRRLQGLRLPQREYLANRMAMQELVRPGGLGDFKVLAQGKSVGKPALQGFQTEGQEYPGLLKSASGWQVPLLAPEHIPLLVGRYPHLAQDWDHLWPWAEGGQPEQGER